MLRAGGWGPGWRWLVPAGSLPPPLYRAAHYVGIQRCETSGVSDEFLPLMTALRGRVFGLIERCLC